MVTKKRYVELLWAENRCVSTGSEHYNSCAAEIDQYHFGLWLLSLANPMPYFCKMFTNKQTSKQTNKQFLWRTCPSSIHLSYG
jgi:hypothetical protein